MPKKFDTVPELLKGGNEATKNKCIKQSSLFNVSVLDLLHLFRF